jgi:hypothetical protein
VPPKREYRPVWVLGIAYDEYRIKIGDLDTFSVHI